MAAAAVVAAASVGAAAPASATWTQQRAFTSPADDFGAPVALSGDGNTALVGAQDQKSGEVFVYQRTGTAWSLQQTLTARSPSPVYYFGGTIALSGDGGTALVSALNLDPKFAGEVFVFQRNGTAWTQRQVLTATDAGPYGWFGQNAIALSGDGTSALITGSKNDAQLTGASVVYAFHLNGTAWSQEQEISGTNGGLVAINRDGSTALIGNYVFAWTGAKWTRVQMLTDPSAAAAGWSEGGSAGALSGNGDSIMLGARNNAGYGAIVLFSKEGTLWAPQQLMPLAAANDDDYIAEALSDDGSVALVGVSGPETAQETVYMLLCTGTKCTHQKVVNKSNDPTGSGTLFLTTVGLSGDGTTALFGDGYQAAYVFTS